MTKYLLKFATNTNIVTYEYFFRTDSESLKEEPHYKNLQKPNNPSFKSSYSKSKKVFKGIPPSIMTKPKYKLY